MTKEVVSEQIQPGQNKTRAAFVRLEHLAKAAGSGSIKPGFPQLRAFGPAGRFGGEQGLCPNGILITALKRSTCLTGPN